MLMPRRSLWFIKTCEIISNGCELGEVKGLLIDEFGKRVIDSSLVKDDLVVPEVDHLLVGVITEADYSLQTFRFQLLGVNRWKHLLKTSTDHLNLSVIAEVVQDHEWVSKRETERLTAIMYDVLHSAVIHHSKGHLSTTNFDDSDVIS
jgi:hypothetical protein